MPRTPKTAQKKGKRKKEERHDAAEPVSKRLKHDALDFTGTHPPTEPSTSNTQRCLINETLSHNAVNPIVERHPPPPSHPSNQDGHPPPIEHFLGPYRIARPRMPLRLLQIPNPQNILPGLRPQIIPRHIRTSTGTFLAHIVVQPGANIRQPFPLIVSSNLDPGIPVLHVRIPTPVTGSVQTEQKPAIPKRPVRSYTCTVCLERFPTNTKLNDHQRVHKDKPQQRRILCAHPDCKILFKDFKELDKHFQESHIQLDLRCDVCGRKFINSFDMNRHKEGHN